MQGCALNLTRLACPCDPLGAQPLRSINATGLICSPPQLTEEPAGEPREATSRQQPLCCCSAPIMWLFGIHGQASHGCSAALFCFLALCVCQRCRGLPVWTGGGGSGQNAAEFSVPLVLLLTDTGVAQTGANEGATPAPAAGPEDDNSLGYTGTAAAPACLSFCWNVSDLGKVKVVLDGDKREPFSAFLSQISTKSFIFGKKKSEAGLTLSSAVFGFIFKNDKSV